MSVPEFHDASPAARLEAHFRAEWERGGQPMAGINPALAVEAVGFTRYEGDWLGVVIAPWFFRLFLLPGGGRIWGDIPVGQSRYLSLAGETMKFVAATSPVVGAFQYSVLLESTVPLADMDAARRMAAQVMQAFAGPPTAAPAAPEKVEPSVHVSRRGFFRRLAGKH